MPINYIKTTTQAKSKANLFFLTKIENLESCLNIHSFALAKTNIRMYNIHTQLFSPELCLTLADMHARARTKTLVHVR